MQDRVEHGRHRPADEGLLTRQQFVQHDPEREDVGTGIHVVAEGLLGRHIGHGSDQAAVAFRVQGIAGPRESGFLSAPGLHLGQTEVENLDPAVDVHHDIRGFHVTVDDAAAMRGPETVGDLLDQVQDAVEPGLVRRTCSRMDSPATNSSAIRARAPARCPVSSTS